MKPVILLTGKNGQIGAELLRFLPQMGEVVALDREHLDLSKPDDISRAPLTFRTLGHMLSDKHTMPCEMNG